MNGFERRSGIGDADREDARTCDVHLLLIPRLDQPVDVLSSLKNITQTTNAAARDKGNYVMFENVGPALDGTLLLTVTPQSTNVGNAGYFPPINALQLVKVVPVVLPPSLTSSYNKGTSTLTLSWTDTAQGYVLETSSKLGAGAAWSNAPGAPNPIAAAERPAPPPATITSNSKPASIATKARESGGQVVSRS